MSERTGVGMVELGVLETLDELGAGPNRPFVKCATVLERLATSRGVAPRYGYEALCALAAPWLVHVRLVTFHGNLGSADDHDDPSGPRYAECRLSPAGRLTLEAERGLVPPLPIGFINGDVHLEGTAPPFAPERVFDALGALLDDRRASDAEVAERVGSPAFPTRCAVEGDVAALAAGQPVHLCLMAHVTVERGDGVTRLVVSRLPPGVGPTTVAQAIANRAEHHARNAHRPAAVRAAHAAVSIPLRDVRNETTTDTRVVCELLPGADVDESVRRVRDTWGVRRDLVARLPASAGTLLRSITAPDTAAQRRAIDRLGDTLTDR